METTASSVSACVSPINFAISFADASVCSANFRTSSATTANPLPAAPAREASIEAFKANKFV